MMMSITDHFWISDEQCIKTEGYISIPLLRMNSYTSGKYWSLELYSVFSVTVLTGWVHFSIVNLLPLFSVHWWRHTYLCHPPTCISFSLDNNCSPILWLFTSHFNPLFLGKFFWCPCRINSLLIDLIVFVIAINRWISDSTALLLTFDDVSLAIFLFLRRHL